MGNGFVRWASRKRLQTRLAHERPESRGRPIRIYRLFGRLLAVLGPVLIVAWLAQTATAATMTDLRGPWSDTDLCVSGGNCAGVSFATTFDITSMDLSSGSFSGTYQSADGSSGTISGSESGAAVTFRYTESSPESYYIENSVGQINADGSMSGTWTDNYRGGAQSGTWSASRISAAPFAISRLGQGNGSATVSWTAESSVGGSPVTSYRVTAREAGNDRVPAPSAPMQSVSVPASTLSATLGGLVEDCHQLYTVSVTPVGASGGVGPAVVSSVFRPSGIVIPHKKPPYVVVLLDGIGSQAAGFRMDPYHPTAVGPDSYCPQNINNGIPVPITVGTGANKRPNNAFLAAPRGPEESFLKWNAWDPADNHGGNVPETDSNSTPRDLHTGNPTFQWMLDGIAARGAMILPYSYWGATLQGHGSADPTFVFNAYTGCNSTPAPICTQDNHLDPGGIPDPSANDQCNPVHVLDHCNRVHSFTLSEDEDRLKTEVDSIEKVWRNEPIVIIGHSQGGLITFETWRKHMLPGAVKHLFSLDSPINGVCGLEWVGYTPNFDDVGGGCLGPPGYPTYQRGDLTWTTDRFDLRQDGGRDPAFRFIGTFGDEVRANIPGSQQQTPGYEVGSATLQHQLLVVGSNCTSAGNHASCPSPPDHVSECVLPEGRQVNNRNRWIYDTGHFVVKWCPGNVAYFNRALGLTY
jgi:hypothetical protein